MTLEIQEISVQISVLANADINPIADYGSAAAQSLPHVVEQTDLIVQRCVREVLHRLRLLERR
jgi:hypothetical protein